jgi:threonine synthase
LLQADALAAEIGLTHLSIKDESRNPTHSMEDRGASCAVSNMKGFGARKIATVSTSRQATSIAAYAALGGLEVRAYLRWTTPRSDILRCRAAGAQVVTVDDDFSRSREALSADTDGWLNSDAFHDPYWLEGVKTLGYELAEQRGWELPDVIICPVENGLAIVGIWKAFRELEILRWIGSKRPKMIAVETKNRVPVPPAFSRTVADILSTSSGMTVAVADEEMLEASLLTTRRLGIFPALETGACIAAARKLRVTGVLQSADDVLVQNIASGLTQAETYSRRLYYETATEQDKLGGLITPR